MPYRVNKWNLDIGLELYDKLLGVKPTIWYINEQAYSGGLIKNYLDHGAKAIVMEWNNARTLHPDWPDDAGDRPQIAFSGGYRIPVIWNDSIAFQKFQRYAHDDDTTLDNVFKYLEQKGDSKKNKWLCLYGSDAEVFNFRPGRFYVEKDIKHDEWERIRKLYEYMSERAKLVLPSQALKNKGTWELKLESPSHPIVVKKQPKYNVTRWAVTGKDSLLTNSSCHFITNKPLTPEGQKQLCYLWSSDFRTHITEKRWEEYKEALKESRDNNANTWARWNDNEYLIETKQVKLVLNKKKGFSIKSLSFGNKEVIKTIPHGYYDEITLGADFFSGNTIFQVMGQPQVTDLEEVREPFIIYNDDDKIGVTAVGSFFAKTYYVWKNQPIMELRTNIMWTKIPKGSLVTGILTFNPEVFDKDTLFYETHNGGDDMERFMLKGSTVNHSQPVSNIVTASGGIGATEGVVISVTIITMSVSFDQTMCAALPMLNYVETRKSYFLRLLFSVAECDESRPDFVDGPINFVVRMEGK